MTDPYEQQPFDPGPFIDNPGQRCPCLLLLDVSASMSGRPIEELNAGLILLKDELSADPLASKRVQIGVVIFGPVETVTDFIDAGQWNTPVLTTKGNTPMGAAIERGLQMLESQKIYKSNGIPHYRPWIFLITDGGPTDSWQNAARLVHEGEANKKFKFFAVGVEGANFDILKQISVQDRAGCLTVETRSGPVIVAVVSDGAGSAQEAARGASIVCSEFHRRVGAYLRSGGALADIDAEHAADWIDSVRDRINFAAVATKLQPRDYAATLIALLANDQRTIVLHIGDGAAVVRNRETQEWSVPSWPFHGEYASTTHFVIDDPQAQFEIIQIDSSIDRFAVFSDGIENLVLDHRARSAPAPFFERLLEPVATWEGTGRSRKLSKHLRDYLGSETVSAATDDDKSLILGARP